MAGPRLHLLDKNLCRCVLTRTVPIPDAIAGEAWQRRSRPCDRGARSEPGEDSSPSILVEPISWRTSAGEVSRGRTGLRMRGAGLPSARLSKRRRASRRATSSSPSSRAPQEPVQRGIPFSIFLPNDMWSEDDGRDGGREEQAAVLLAGPASNFDMSSCASP